jgi:hypothetical protein
MSQSGKLAGGSQNEGVVLVVGIANRLQIGAAACAITAATMIPLQAVQAGHELAAPALPATTMSLPANFTEVALKDLTCGFLGLICFGNANDLHTPNQVIFSIPFVGFIWNFIFGNLAIGCPFGFSVHADAYGNLSISHGSSC